MSRVSEFRLTVWQVSYNEDITSRDANEILRSVSPASLICLVGNDLCIIHTADADATKLSSAVLTGQ